MRDCLAASTLEFLDDEEDMIRRLEYQILNFKK